MVATFGPMENSRNPHKSATTRRLANSSLFNQNLFTISIFIILSSFSLQLATSRRLPSFASTTAASTLATHNYEIVLGEKPYLRESLPELSRVHLRCNLKNLIWFKNGGKMNMEIRRKEILKFEKITKSDAGIYSCRSTDTQKWSNLTLNILPVKSGVEQKLIHNDYTSASIQSLSQISNNNNNYEDHQNDQMQDDHDDDNDDDDEPVDDDEDDYDESYAYLENEFEQNSNADSNLASGHINPSNTPHQIVGSDQKNISTSSTNNGGTITKKPLANNDKTSTTIATPGNGSLPVWKSKESLLLTLPKPSGSFIKLSCAANGNPTPNITWTKDGKSIERIMGKINYKKWIMSMEEAIPEDSGYYTCTVCNPNGCINHTTKLIIQDRVNHKPIVLKHPENLIIKVDDPAEFSCEFLSDLHHEIGWLFVSCKDNICQNKTNLLKTDSDKSEVLKLENVKHSDEGWYTCIAANSLGQSNSSAYLRVVDEFETPVSMPVKIFPLYMTIFKISIGVLFIFGTAVVLTIVRKIKQDKLMKHRMETIHQWTKKVIIYKPSADPSSPETIVMPIIKIEKQRTTLLKSSNCSDPSPFNEYEFPLDSNWEIPRNQIIKGKTLGEGAFGRVIMAEAMGLPKHPGRMIVAVKMVKEGHTDADIASLVREMEVMKMIGKHINIIDFLGCCSQEGPLYVIVEYAKYGNLKDFLESNGPNAKYDQNLYEDIEKKNLTQKDLLSFAFQAARGMEYLASKRCIHRDLAARNVLVSEDYVIKIADFGLARDIQDTDYYRKNTNGQLPIKWMAPESLKDKFYDTQSDVWSYGVLLWEIMTFGEKPYRNIISVEELYNYLMSGQRMEKPPTCSLNIYMLMRQCWNFEPHCRPTFTEIVENLDKILTATANANEEYLDLGVPTIETPPSSSDEEDDDDDESDAETLRETSLMRYKY